MLSQVGDSEPTLTTVHFLKLVVNSVDGPYFKFNKFSSSSYVFVSKGWPLKINFTGWHH